LFFSEVAEIEVSEDGVGESEEFFLVNFTWGLFVNSFAGLLNPFPFGISDDVVLGFSELLKSSFDLTVGEGSVVVSIEGFETFFSLFPVNALSSSFSSFFLHFSSDGAEIEVSEEGVGELVEFFSVNFTWGLGVDLFTGLLNPFPFGISDFVVKGFSELLNSNFDFIVGEEFAIVGIEGFETFVSKSSGDADIFLLGVDSDGSGGGNDGSKGEFHFVLFFVFLLYDDFLWLKK
jgi:hypothetical protein